MFESISHFRELGGCKTTSGKKIKYGLIYRSGNLSQVNDKELELLKSFNIDTVYDLRNEDEYKNAKDKEANYKIIYCPLDPKTIKVSGEFKDPRSLNDKLKVADKAYYNFLLHRTTKIYMSFPYNIETIRMIIESLNKHETFLFHCFGGKDRTGGVAMLIMLFLGCDYKTCKKNYMFHNKLAKNEYDDYLKYIESVGPSKYGKKAMDFLFYTWDFLFDSMYFSIFDEYKTIEDYLKDQFGIDKEQIDDWRNFYLE